MKKWLPVIALSIGGLGVAALALMLLWNSFLAQVTNVSTLTYWQAVKGWLFTALTIGIFWWAKTFASFVMLTVSMAITSRNLKKTADEQKELLKHFGMFKKNE